MRQPRIDRQAEDRLQEHLDAAVRKALDKIKQAVADSLHERTADRGDSASE